MRTTSTSLTLARALFFCIGIGALLMVLGNLTSGQSLADPVFPAGLVLGVLTVSAASWVDAPARWQAIATWLGLLAMAIGLAVIASMAARSPSPDVIALAGVPSLILLAASLRLGIARSVASGMGR